MALSIPLAGTCVTHLRIDYAFTMSFDAEVDLRTETVFSVTAPDGRSDVVDPGADPDRTGFLRTLHHAAADAP